MLLRTLRFLTFRILTNKMHQLNYHKTDHKTLDIRHHLLHVLGTKLPSSESLLKMCYTFAIVFCSLWASVFFCVRIWVLSLKDINLHCDCVTEEAHYCTVLLLQRYTALQLSISNIDF